MRIDKIIIKNIGPFDKLVLKLNGESVALVGANATGKTFLLSSVVDFIYEHLRIVGFNDTLPSVGNGYRYFRMTNKRYVKDRSQNGFIWIEGTLGDEKLYYLEEYGFDSPSQLADIINVEENLIPWPRKGMVKAIKGVSNDGKESAKEIAWNEPIFFLPATKFENESWKTENFYRDNYVINSPTSSQLGHPIEMYSSLDDNKTWLTNEAVDEFLYHKVNTQKRISLINYLIDKLTMPNANAHLNFTGNRGDRLNVVDGNGEVILESLDYLSLGQTSVLNLALNILRLGKQDVAPNEITGLVVIDEIDTHLTGAFKYSVVPELIKAFPRVQFIITTHDAESVSGLENNSSIKLIELPSGEPIYARDFSELRKARNNLKTISRNTRRIIKKAEDSSKPVLVVEDEYDNIYKVGWLKINEKEFTKESIAETFASEAPFEIISANGSRNLQAFLNVPILREAVKNKKIMGLFDYDQAYNDFLGLKNCGWSETIEGDDRDGIYKRNQDGLRCAMLLPVPAFRQNIASSAFKGNSRLGIELYFDDDTLGNQHCVRDISMPGNVIMFAGNKPTFWEECVDLPKEKFDSFKKLFDKVEGFLLTE